MKQHHGAVVKLKFSQDGNRLFSGDSHGTVCVYDVTQQFHLVGIIETAAPSVVPTFSKDHSENPRGHFGDVLAVGRLSPVLVVRSPTGDGGLVIYNWTNLSIEARIPPSGGHVVRFRIRPVRTPSGFVEELVVLEEEGFLRQYSLQTGTLARSRPVSLVSFFFFHFFGACAPFFLLRFLIFCLLCSPYFF